MVTSTNSTDDMSIQEFIDNYREAFGSHAPLPIVFEYSDTRMADTEKTCGCFFKAFDRVRQGEPVSLNADKIGCGGGKFHTGFSPMPERVPRFVSFTERYKETPEQVLDFIRKDDIQITDKLYLNFSRIDKVESLDTMEGLLFFATPDMLSGLATWAFFDNNADDAVSAIFSSGCGSVVTFAVRENRIHGHRCFIGLLDPSVRPHISENELSFVIPRCRFEQMQHTMRRCCLFNTPAWQKVKARINT